MGRTRNACRIFVAKFLRGRASLKNKKEKSDNFEMDM
jgi:hypothetical protein